MHRTPSRIPRRIRAVLIPALLATLSACQLLPPEYQPQEDPVRPPYSGPEFRTAEVERGDMRIVDTLHFTYEPIRHAELGFETGGLRLEAIYVEAGDTVREGELLAELEGGQAAALLDERRAALAQHDRHVADLIEDHAFALEEEAIWLEASDADDATRTEALEALEAQQAAELDLLDQERRILALEVEESEERVRTGQIHAPFDGLVTYTRQRSVGEIVRRGETMVEVSDTSASLFIGRLMEMGDTVTPGTEWTITSDEIPYPVRMVDPEDLGIEPVEGRGYALLTVDDVHLDTGTKGTLDVIRAESLDALYLPRRAVFTIGGDPMVYMQNEDGLRVAQPVTTGIVTPSEIEIVSGLEEGDFVVIG